MDTSRQLIFDLLRTMTVGVLMFDNESNLILANPFIRSMTGVYRGDAVLKDFINLFRKERDTKMHTTIILDLSFVMEKVLHQGGKAVFFKQVLLGEKVFELVVTPIRNDKYAISGGAFIFYDITQLQAVDRMKTEFVSLASHQLRTPLTAIKLFSEMLLSGEVGNLQGKQKEYLQNIHDSTDRMAALVNDLLNVSRLEEGRLRIEPVINNIVKLIDKIVKEHKFLAEDKKCNIKFEVGDLHSSDTFLDPVLFGEIVGNLLDNAIQYSEGKRCDIIVRLEQKNNNFIVSVKDFGTGIAKKDQKRIFERFYRTDNAVKSVTKGTGLGLYLVKMITDAFGGKVWFESEGIGKGTTFYVEIPLKGMKKRSGEQGLA